MNKTTKTILWVIIVIVVIAAIWYGVSRKSFLTTKEPEVIKIGAILPLSGPIGIAGNQIREGIELALEEYRGKNIEVIFEDSQGKPSNAVSSLQKLINIDKISLILGDIPSGVTLAMIPIAKENDLVIVTPLSTSPKVTQPGNNTYRIVPSDVQEVSYMAKYAYEHLNIRKAAIIYENSDFGVGAKQIFENTYNGTIVASEAYTPDTVDYKAIFTKITQTKPDAIYMLSLPQQIGLILKQAKELGINATFLGKNSVEQPTVLNIAGDAANGVIYTFFSEGPEDKTREFKNSFKKKYGKEPGMFEAIGYDLAKTALLAVQGTQGDKEKIKQNMGKISFEGVTGHVEFEADGNIKEKALTIKTIKNGQFVPY